MQTVTCQVRQIDNGYLVETWPKGNPGPVTTQYCADLNAVSTYLVATFVPGATYTPPPAPPPA